MKFLDLNGLTHFFGKVKTWAGNNYLSLTGGAIRGNVSFYGDYSLIIQETDNNSQQYVKINYANGISIGTHFDEGDETVDYVSINQSYISAPQFKKTNGKSTQALIADGSVREIGSANGIAGLDANGYVPLAQLGNLDTTVAEVVTALPTTNIKKHIYLIKDASGVTQNQYEEYIYTGNTSAAYDASKWEKLGDFRATVDLANYYTKSQVDSIANGKSSTSHTHSVIINGITKTIAASGGTAVNLGTYLTSHQSLADYAKKSEAIDRLIVETQPTGQHSERQFISIYKAGNSAKEAEVSMLEATTNMSGFMSAGDKSKLDNIEYGANDYSLPLAANSTRGGIQLGYTANGRNYPVQLSGEKAYVNVPWTDTNTTYSLATSTNNGLMKASDKAKLDGISSGATADSAITTAEIDALFA